MRGGDGMATPSPSHTRLSLSAISHLRGEIGNEFRAMPVASLFSPAGRSAERMRGDEGGFGEAEAKRRFDKIAFGPPHPAFQATFSPLGRRENPPKRNAIGFKRQNTEWRKGAERYTAIFARSTSSPIPANPR